MPRETDLVRACLTYLSAHRIMAWRNNSGATRIDKRSPIASIPTPRRPGRAGTARRARFVRFGEPGSPDIIGILPDGRFLGVECKVESRQLTKLQLDFQQRVQKAGGLYVIVRDSIDALIPLILTDWAGRPGWQTRPARTGE